MPLENEKIEVAEEKETEMPNVEELLKILLDVNLEQNRQTVHLLMNYMNDIEENFFSVLEELDTVKAQLAQVQQIPQTKEVRHYSLGMKQKVYLMAAFLSGAGNLILDEPFNGLDPESVAMLKNLLSEYRDRGNLVLFSIHNLDLVANFCDDIVFIDKQRKVFQTENPKDFKQLEDVFFQKCV